MKERLEQEVQLGQRSVYSCGKVTGVGTSLISCKQGKEQIQKSIRPKETAEQKKMQWRVLRNNIQGGKRLKQ